MESRKNVNIFLTLLIFHVNIKLTNGLMIKPKNGMAVYSRLYFRHIGLMIKLKKEVPL